MANSMIPVNIVVADRSFRLKINAEDEEVVRKTVKVINDKIVEFKTNFAGKDMQDYISMVLLWFATEQQKPTPIELMNAEATERLQKLDTVLTRSLEQ